MTLRQHNGNTLIQIIQIFKKNEFAIESSQRVTEFPKGLGSSVFFMPSAFIGFHRFLSVFSVLPMKNTHSNAFLAEHEKREVALPYLYLVMKILLTTDRSPSSFVPSKSGRNVRSIASSALHPSPTSLAAASVSLVEIVQLSSCLLYRFLTV